MLQGDTVPGSQCNCSRWTVVGDGWNGRVERMSHDVEGEISKTGMREGETQRDWPTEKAGMSRGGGEVG